jgi:hypothetical protein
MQPLRRAKSHQLVVGRVVINPFESAPLRIESAKAWRIVVGEAREIGSASAAGNPADLDGQLPPISIEILRKKAGSAIFHPLTYSRAFIAPVCKG